MPKFYKTIVHYEVLSKDHPWEGSLENLIYDTTYGNCSGSFLQSTVIELTPDEMKKACREQDTDIEFFHLHDENC